ncbi:ATP-binding protein [Paenibacillus periandrae]|uniref:ATP-binding protein n=1 Tax=Paenibacillus periandrae TaxID=1761741 RepID=UPI001F09E0D5|nr:ATP-binding protein [Paenibacillus periandrae]
MILPFELDPQIIHHIIHSQAGSIGKAIIELLMNSVDARATSVRFSMNKQGFTCEDDGTGFASKDDVLRYFGRFGTPHQEGDATYGRFRLGRGQIMAHASTVWKSNIWEMTVDTITMGYNYNLEQLLDPVQGCRIGGVWYESLTDQELMSAIQEVRDLVRYTPINVELNGQLITRIPQNEKWDFEDEFAYYRIKEDGAVSIYNQGVLVRHDAGHIWGAGGLVVSKQAIALNVSRTEILRKTCPVWKAISKQFTTMAQEISNRLGDHRKTEARREKSARSLLSGDANIAHIFRKEEVVTLLPGKRHVTMEDFLRKSIYSHDNKITIVTKGFDIPRGEAIARQGIALVVHPQTLERFGCYSPEEFQESVQRIINNLKENEHNGGNKYWGRIDNLVTPDLLSFDVLRDSFIDRTHIVTEKNALDKETRRVWTSLRWCLQNYAGACLGKEMYTNGRVYYQEKVIHILVGESTIANAWTDGSTYIAFNINIVKKLKTDPVKVAAYIFSLLEHEIAHEGDSLDSGHDEAFFERYHDISIRMSSEKQRYLHIYLMKYTMSLEREGKPATGLAYQERFLMDRVGNGRIKKGLTRGIDDVSTESVVTSPIPVEDLALIELVNMGLVNAGINPDPPDWLSIIEQAREAQLERDVSQAEDEEDITAMKEIEFEPMQEIEFEARRVAEILGIPFKTLDIWTYEYYFLGLDDEQIRAVWEEKPWSHEDGYNYSDEEEVLRDPFEEYKPEFHHLLKLHDTVWALERNAAAAGFHRVEEYLKWREEQKMSILQESTSEFVMD